MTLYSDQATPPTIEYVERFVTINILHTLNKPECGIVDCPCHGEDTEDKIAGCPSCGGEYICQDDQRQCRLCGLYECPLCQASHEEAFDLRWMAGETGAIARIATASGVTDHSSLEGKMVDVIHRRLTYRGDV